MLVLPLRPHRLGQGVAVLAVCALSSPVAAQSSLDFFGLVRPDGVVMPELVRQDGVWVPTTDVAIEGSEPPDWAATETYYYTDLTSGASSVLRAGSAVVVCCEYNGNPAWAHATERSGDDVAEFVLGADGYVVTRQEGNAPFLSIPSELTPSFQELVDSLSTLPDSLPRRLQTDAWRAEYGGRSYVFFQVVEEGDGRYMGCYVIAGWLEGGIESDVSALSSGRDDCEGKGHGRRRPWALLARDGELGAAITVDLWGSDDVEVWPVGDTDRW